MCEYSARWTDYPDMLACAVDAGAALDWEVFAAYDRMPTLSDLHRCAVRRGV